jgi:large subunit ribosomal protein L25
MSSHDLNVVVREEKGKSVSRRLRYAGRLPAVVYGRNEEPVKLSVDAKELRDFLARHGSRGLFSLNTEDGTKTPAIIKALQRHPFKNHVQTIDFLRVSLSEKVNAVVPIVLEGEPVGVKVDGGILVQSMHQIEISALPQDLPEAIHADVSHLEFNGAPLLIKEIKLPAGITAISDGEEDVAVVNAPDTEPAEAAEGEAGEEAAASAE